MSSEMLGRTAMVLLTIGSLGVGLGFAVLALLKHSDAYKLATEHARHHPALERTVGSVQSFGFFLFGSVQLEGASGRAEFSMSVRGTRGKAKLHYLLLKHLGQWHVVRAVLERTGERIVLTDAAR